MASAGRQSQDNSKTKAPITPEQRKLYAGLGVGGLLALVAGIMYLPGLFSGKGAAPVTPSPTNTVSTADAAAGGEGTPGADAASGGTAPATTVVSAPAAPLGKFRSDPFQPLYFIPTPTPTPPPIPSPVVVPSPGEATPVMLPDAGPSRAQLQQPLNLPPVSINRLDEAARRPVDAFPPRRSASGEGGGSAGANPSQDKRLSGIIISDGVRALLEVQGPDGPKTTVVQPGDEINGITVLSIARFNDGTRTVTRMIIRENGEERSVDLRPGAQLTPGGPPGQPGA